jgi:hypothetical protein
MYGLVNSGFADYVRRNYGVKTWDRIVAQAGVSSEVFVSMESYPDDVTYKLVGAATEVLGVGIEKILESFGEHWVLVTAKEGYGILLGMFGDNMKDFLKNLDSMHARMGTTFPKLRPPSFVCRDIDAHTSELEYHSERAGLTPFVVGLLKGLGKYFETPVDIKVISTKSESVGHDTFLLTWSGQGGR